jgi:hypothetical protein
MGMMRYRIQGTIEVPDDVTIEEVLDWVNYELGLSG